MSAILNSLIGARRGRRDDEPDLDSIYGDFHITAPNGHGYPSKHADLYVKEVESGHDTDDEHRSLRKQSSDITRQIAQKPVQIEPIVNQDVRTGRNYEHASSASVNGASGVRQRSRSQSGFSTERRNAPDHRVRSSSSNRTGRSREPDRSDRYDAAESVPVFSRIDLRGDRSPGEGISRPTASRTSPPDHVHVGIPTRTRDHNTSYAALDLGGEQRKIFQYPLGNINSILERSVSPAVTILSPVSESFASEDTHQQLDGSAGSNEPVRAVHKPHPYGSSTPAPSSLSRAASPQTFAHGDQYVNPLALHSTSHSRAYSQRLALSPELEIENDSITVQTLNSDKPLPAFPTGSAQSPPFGSTSFARTSSRTGPGLGATAIMRPSSRNNHVQDYGHSQARLHQRSASLSHVAYGTIPPPSVTPLSYGRKGSYPEESKDLVLRSQPSSAGSGISSASQSSWSHSQVSTPPLDEPETSRGPHMATSPTLGLTNQRRSSDFSPSVSYQPPLPTASPPPVVGGMTVSSMTGGNIYNELRDDLRVVGRDLTATTLAEEREREKKRSKLRLRARSASRNDRRSERARDSDRDYERRHQTRHDQVQDLDASRRLSAEAVARGKPGFVAAYDLPSTRGHGRDYADPKSYSEGVVTKKAQVEMVPDYEDLWC